MGNKKRQSKSDGKRKRQSKYDDKIIDGIRGQESTDPSKTTKLEIKHEEQKEDSIFSDGGEITKVETKVCSSDSTMEVLRESEADTSPTEGRQLAISGLLSPVSEERPDESPKPHNNHDSDDGWGESMLKMHRFKVRTFHLEERGHNNGGGGGGTTSNSGGSRRQGSQSVGVAGGGTSESGGSRGQRSQGVGAGAGAGGSTIDSGGSRGQGSQGVGAGN